LDQRLILQSAALAVLALSVAGFAGYKLVSGADLPQRTSAAASQHPSPPGGHSRLPSASSPVVRASTAQASPATTPSPPSPSPVPVQALVPASVRRSARSGRPMATTLSWRRSPSAGTRPRPGPASGTPHPLSGM